jgi:AraC-like DNA-binding protein
MLRESGATVYEPHVDLRPRNRLLTKLALALLSGREAVGCAIPGLTLTRRPKKALEEPSLLPPSLMFIIQGARRLKLGSSSHEVRVSDVLINALPLPVIDDAGFPNDEGTYIAIELVFDLGFVERIRHEVPGRIAGPLCSSVAKGDAPDWLVEGLIRMCELSFEEMPDQDRIDSLQSELLRRLLFSPLGRSLHQAALPGSHTYRVGRAIRYLQDRFTQPLVVADLASHCHWATSSLHHVFRRLTSMTPLQYQQFLRLSEARRKLLHSSDAVGEVARQVGYTSASQFNREYRRLFGVPPLESVRVL